jgi:hypothetical protein
MSKTANGTRKILNEDKLKEGLNGTGVFLEDAVAHFLNSEDHYSITKREVPYSLGIYEKTGTIDILHSTLQPGIENNLILPIECKKSTDQSKIWVFIPDSEFEDLIIFEKLSSQDGKTDINYCVSNNNAINSPFCINSFQYHFRNATINRSNEVRPYEAMRSTNQFISSLHFLSDPIKYCTNLQNEDASWILFPVVCTNSKLYIAQYNNADITLRSGDLDPNKIEIEEKPWIFYKFPVTWGINPKIEKEYPGKRLTIIVNSMHLNTLKTYLITELGRYANILN